MPLLFIPHGNFSDAILTLQTAKSYYSDGSISVFKTRRDIDNFNLKYWPAIQNNIGETFYLYLLHSVHFTPTFEN